ncbi:MAG: hypothetical protein ACRYF2_08690 [Janthinobacterium lividum]
MGNSYGGAAPVRMAVLALVAAVMPVAAQAGCDWDDLVRDEAGAATVRSTGARVYFVKDDVLHHGCPNDSAACRGAAYLMAGDAVLTGPAQGQYVCAGFVGAKGAQTIGWLPAAAMAPLPEAAQRPSDWAGNWMAPEQELVIAAAAGGALAVKGDATWGMGDPQRRRTGGIHTGEVAGTAQAVNGVLAFTMGDDDKTLPYEAGDEFTCRIRLLRRGPYLIARDNNACGGVNVSFSGFYRRKS